MSLLLSLFVCLPPAAQDDSSAAALMDRVQEALGPRPAGALRLAGRASWAGLEIRGTFEEVYGGPAHARLRAEYTEFGVVEHRAAGELVWEDSPHGLQQRSGWEACEVLRRFGREQHLPWRDLYASARVTGRERVGEHECRVLSLTPRWLLPGEPEGEPVDDVWYVDVETSLPRRILSRTPGRSGEPTEVRIDYADWREAAGGRFAHRREVSISNFTLVYEVDAVEAGAEVPAGFFDVDQDTRGAIAARAAAAEREGSGANASISIEELEERHVATIRVMSKHEDMQKTLATILPEAMEAATASGARFTGPPFVRYHNWGPDLDIEGGMPVASPIEPKGRVKPSVLPGGRAVVAWHVGPYTELGATHARIAEYLEEERLLVGAAPWEEYWTDPGMEPDPGKWRTKVVYPLAE